MNPIRIVVCVTVIALSGLSCRAQIAVGTVTRDSGLYVGSRDASDMKEVNKFLNDLESDLAEQVTNQGAVQYQDRTSVRELFHELRLSSSAAFDGSSGATRGLMGRLDFLIVIDALDSSTAKMRLIDIETGGVRGIETCSKHSSLFGKPATPDCVHAMATRIAAAGQQKSIVKKSKQEKLVQEQADFAKRQAEQAKAAQQRQAAADARLAQQAEIAHAEENKARLAEESANRQAAVERAAAAQAVLSLKPAWMMQPRAFNPPTISGRILGSR